MNKKLVFWMTAVAMMGLSACGNDGTNACEGNAKRCDGNNVEICTDAAWTVQTQCTGTTTCNPMTLQCEEPTLSCDGDEKRCNGKNIETCKAGSWALDIQCESTQVCNPKTYTCEDLALTCDGDEKRCNDKKIEMCKTGAWVLDIQCEGLLQCNPMTFQCEEPTGSCDSDAKRCNGKNIETCKAGSWALDIQCESTQVCNPKTYTCEDLALTCEENATQCTANGKLETCKAKTWVRSDCGADQICPSDKTACEKIVCDAGKTKCHDTKNLTLACVNNAWVEKTICSGATALCEDGKCVACKTDEKRCEYNAVEHCVDNQWDTMKECQKQVCNDTTYTCDDRTTCVGGEKRCENNDIKQCSESIWKIVTACDNRGCDTTSNTCKSELTKSTILSCNSVQMNTKTEIATGQADTVDGLNAAVVGRFFCGTEGQAISAFQEVLGAKHTPGDAYEHMVDIGSLDNGRHLCVWFFTQPGEKTVVCKAGTQTGFITNHNAPPAKGEALNYSVVNFENCLFDDSTATYNGVCSPFIEFKNASIIDDLNAIEKHSLKLAQYSSAEATFSKGIKEFTLEVKNTSKSTAVTLLLRLGKNEISAEIPKNVGTVLSQVVNDSKPGIVSITTSGPITIDNARWTDY